MILALLVIAPASAETDCDYHNAVSVDPLLEPECAESEQQDDAVKYKGDNKGTTDKRSYLKLTNGEGFTPIAEPTGAIVDETPMLEAALRKEQSWKNKQTFWDRFKAAVQETHLLPELIRTLDEDHGEYDPKFMQHFRNNWQRELEFAQSQDEADQLLEATSYESLNAIKERIVESRERNRIIDSNGTGTAFRIVAGMMEVAILVLGLFLVSWGFASVRRRFRRRYDSDGVTSHR